eukprot:1230224-Amphidinium_carterae.1
MISGRQTFVVLPRRGGPNTEAVLLTCCEKLDIRATASMCLVIGAVVVPASTAVHDWPGVPACDEISEYQLIV